MSVVFMFSYVLLWILVVMLVVAVFALGRQIGVLHVRLPAGGARLANAGPEIGVALPTLKTVDLAGRDIFIGGLKAKNALLLFVSLGCSACERLTRAIKATHKGEAKSWEIVLISIDSDTEANRDFVRRNGLEELAYVASGDLSDFFKVKGTPYGLALDRKGIVRSKGIVNTREHLESLLTAVELGYSSIEDYSEHSSSERETVKEGIA